MLARTSGWPAQSASHTRVRAWASLAQLSSVVAAGESVPATTEDDLVRQASGDWRIYQVGVKRDSEVVDVVYRNASYASCLEGRFCGDGEKSKTKP